MKILNIFGALTLLLSLNAKAELSETPRTQLPTLCIGNEVQGAFGRGIAIVLTPQGSQVSAKISYFVMYGFHIRTNDLLATTESLNVTTSPDGSFALENQDIQIILGAEQNARWNGFVTSNLSEEVGSNHAVTCSTGELKGRMQQYLP